MCFSSSASFAVGTYLLAAGALTLRHVRHPRELPFAAIPLLFAIQQFSEGVIWLTFRHDAPAVTTLMTGVYSFFSHVLWPVYIPVAALLVEPLRVRRRVQAVLGGVGLGVGAYLLYQLVEHPLIARQGDRHIEYLTPPHYMVLATLLYAVATTISLMVSSHRMVRAFGVLTLLSFALAYGIYEAWFISVWCFFAAALSTVVVFHFFTRGTLRVVPA